MSVCARCAAPLPEGAQFCPACGTPLGATAAPVDERKLVTVLFADLVGSTALGSGQDPERTRVLLERFYEAMSAEITLVGGTVEKFAGDAVMAVFGAPDALEDHAERALHAALAMQRRLQLLFRETLRMRIGVNTGEVVVGKPREGSAIVTGDAVNVAKRLEEAASAGEIFVGERTVGLVRGAFEFGTARRVAARGKEHGVVGAGLVRALTLMRPRGVGGLRRAFVGRSEELDLLLATYARTVRQGGPHVVTIMASAGVGKTRLVRELWERLGAESPEPLRRTGRCLPYGQGITYWALGEILKEQLGILESDPPEAVRERLADRPLLGLALGLDAPGDLHPLAARDELEAAWVDFLDELSRERPVVMLVEDLNWAEPPLLDLLERLARQVAGPLLIIGTARPELLETRPTWGGGMRNASLLWLEPLRAADTGGLIDELLGMSLPHGLRERVVERAEGNPFFVEELLATLADKGVLERRNGSWEVRELDFEFDIPDTVQAVIAARMDLLPAAEKTAMQAAAVCGRIFWPGPVVELLDGAEPDFTLLEERDFIRRRAGTTNEGEREFAFKHALTREVAYGGVPKARRARLHARFARWLERTGGGRPEHVPLLAHHYAEAVRADVADLAWTDDPAELAKLRAEAAEWLQRAGHAAVGRYEIDEGIRLLERALAFADEPKRRAALYRAIGRAHALGFRGREFWEAMERSLELTSDPLERGETFAELGLQTSFRMGMWTRAPDRDVVLSWISQGLELTDPGSLARAKALCASVFWAGGTENDDGAADDAVELSEALGEPGVLATAYLAKAVAAFRERRYDEARAWSERPLRILDPLTDPERYSETLEMLVPANAALGRWDDAWKAANSFDDATTNLSAHHRLHGVSSLVELGELVAEWEVLRQLAPRVERRVRENDATFCIRNQRSLLVCAAAHLAAGERAESQRLEDEALAIATEGFDLVLSGPRLRLALLRKDLDEAARIVKGLDLNSTQARHSYWFRLSSVLLLLETLAALGDHGRLEAEAERWQGLPGTFIEPFVMRALGQARGERRLIEGAAERLSAMGLHWHAAQTQALL